MFCLITILCHRKVKRELVAEISDSSWAGAVLSILTTLLVVWLIYSELMSFLQVTTVSRLVVDQNQQAVDTLQVCLMHRSECVHLLADLIAATTCLHPAPATLSNRPCGWVPSS
jgi:hypothetical protein